MSLRPRESCQRSRAQGLVCSCELLGATEAASGGGRDQPSSAAYRSRPRVSWASTKKLRAAAYRTRVLASERESQQVG